MKAILVNPKAGGGRAGAQWDRLSAQLPLSRSLPVFMPPSSEAMREVVRQLLSSGCQRLVVVGGDGTLHLVAGEILATGSSEVSLGLVPLGTGCDFARTLGLPKSPREAFTLALEGPAKPVDAGVIDGPGPRVFFVNVASAGISGMVDELVNANPRRGALAFLTATLQALRRYQPRQLAVHVDGQELFSGFALLMAVANGTSFGKGMHIAPLARPNDGLLDVVVVEAVRGLQLVRRLPLVYLGRHLRLPQVRFVRGREVQLKAQEPLPPFDVDGECVPSGPARFSVVPGALQVAHETAGDSEPVKP